MASAAEQGARAVVLLAIFAGIDGHGLMLDPISRNAREGITTLGGNMWFSQGCTIGCSQCNDTGVPVGAGFPVDKEGTQHSPNMGGVGGITDYGDGCPNDHSKSKKPTIMDPSLTTMNAATCAPGISPCVKWSEWHPWRAPGSTPGLDPCGVAGGARTNMSYRAGGFGPETGYPQGFNGSSLPAIPKEQRKVWKSGGTANVSWVNVANHAGGYLWSLCPAGRPLTEACFDEMPLQYVDNTSTLRYMFLLDTKGTLGPNQTEFVIPANRVKEGVLPRGSTWSKNPVPVGGWSPSPGSGVSRWNNFPPQFDPPPGCDEHCWGYQPCNVGFTHPSYEGWNHTHAELPNCSRAGPNEPLMNGQGCCHQDAYMAIVDEIKVPTVPPGDYVVRWRWDCEQSPQIWSGCGDIIITA